MPGSSCAPCASPTCSRTRTSPIPNMPRHASTPTPSSIPSSRRSGITPAESWKRRGPDPAPSLTTMSINLVVRPVTPEDHDQWLLLWEGYNAFYGRSGETALSPEITRMTWTRFFDAYEPVHALVAESGGQLIGL